MPYGFDNLGRLAIIIGLAGLLLGDPWPIAPGSRLREPESGVPAAAAEGESATAGSAVSQRLLGKALWIFDHVTESAYGHDRQPAASQLGLPGAGNDFEAYTDCSGFVSNVLHDVAARHYEEIRRLEPGHSYPQAKIYARFFAQLSAEHPEGGWLKVKDVGALMPGDIIAWEKGDGSELHHGKGNSGHVMIVVEPPQPPAEENVGGQRIRFVSVKVIDSSSVYHFPPEQLPPRCHQDHRGGLGIGFIRLILDDDRRVIGYWEGTYWGEGGRRITRPSYSSMISFGRAIPFHLSGPDR